VFSWWGLARCVLLWCLFVIDSAKLRQLCAPEKPNLPPFLKIERGMLLLTACTAKVMAIFSNYFLLKNKRCFFVKKVILVFFRLLTNGSSPQTKFGGCSFLICCIGTKNLAIRVAILGFSYVFYNNLLGAYR